MSKNREISFLLKGYVGHEHVELVHVNQPIILTYGFTLCLNGSNNHTARILDNKKLPFLTFGHNPLIPGKLGKRSPKLIMLSLMLTIVNLVLFLCGTIWCLKLERQ